MARGAFCVSLGLTVRCTDNYLVLLSHVTRQGVVGAADVRTYLGIDEEYEDVDAA